MINASSYSAIAMSSFQYSVMLKSFKYFIDEISDGNFFGLTSDLKCEGIQRKFTTKTFRTIMLVFVISDPLVGAFCGTISRTFLIFYVHHVFWFAKNTANCHGFSRNIETRYRAITTASFIYDVDHSVGSTWTTTNRNWITRFVESGNSPITLTSFMFYVDHVLHFARYTMRCNFLA